MKALRIHGYGGPQAMRIEEVPTPSPGPGEVLVKLAAATINPIDWKIREGYLKSVLPIQFPRTLGRDGAGIIAALGPGVSDLVPGARVMGLPAPGRDGTHAEYVVLPASSVAVVPAGVGDAEAAACGVAGLSAWLPLVAVAGIKAGDRVLVHAGAGGVGSFAVQIARHAGAEVIATASAANADFVIGLGAHRIVDYRSEDFVSAVRDCDVVLDSVGGDTHVRSLAVLRPGGILVSLAAEPIPAHAPRADVRDVPVRVTYERVHLAALLGAVARGELRPQISRTLPFSRVEEAYAASQQGGVRGKIALTL